MPTEVSDHAATDITDASAIVDAQLSGKFGRNYESTSQAFPDVTSSPATPVVVQLVTKYLAASLQLLRLKQKGNKVDKLATDYRNQSDDWLKRILSGDMEVIVGTANADGSGQSEIKVVEDGFYPDSTSPIFTDKTLEDHL